jgi:ABC-2 type transport system permease protein
VRRHVLVLGGYAHQAFLGALAWRAFMVTLVIQGVVPPLVGLAVWSQALPERGEIAAYFAALIFVRMLTVCYEPHTFLNNIYDGTLVGELLVPRPVVLSVLGSNLAWRAWHVLMALPVLAGLALLTSVRVAWADVALALPAMVLAAILLFLFTYTLVLAAFWTQRAHAIAGAGYLLVILLGGEAAPVPLLPEDVRPWVAALPFRAMMGFPAEIAAGLLSRTDVVVGYAWQVGWVAVFGLCAAWVWRAGVRRYTAVGG